MISCNLSHLLRTVAATTVAATLVFTSPAPAAAACFIFCAWPVVHTHTHIATHQEKARQDAAARFCVGVMNAYKAIQPAPDTEKFITAFPAHKRDTVRHCLTS